MLLALWLSDGGHRVIHFEQGRDLIKGVVKESFDLVALDWMVPDMDGLAVLDWLRSRLDWPIPVLFVTQKDTEADVVSALEHGADDYMAKPVKRYELLARIHALGRRTGTGDDRKEDVLEFTPYRIDRIHRRVQRAGTKVSLTQKEYDLTLFLFRNSGRVVSRGHILESVWGRSAELNTRTVDTHVSRLRKKLDISPANGWQLSSIYQHGYRLERLPDPTDI